MHLPHIFSGVNWDCGPKGSYTLPSRAQPPGIGGRFGIHIAPPVVSHQCCAAALTRRYSHLARSRLSSFKPLSSSWRLFTQKKLMNFQKSRGGGNAKSIFISKTALSEHDAYNLKHRIPTASEGCSSKQGR